MITDPLFYALAIPAVILLGFAKGGFAGLGLLAVPLMALTISPIQALAITLPIMLVQDAVTVWTYRHSWDPLNLKRLLPGAIIGVGLGYGLAAYVPEEAIALVLGLISIVFAIRRLIIERGANLPAAKTAGVRGGWFWGGLSGFTSMVAHAGGPPFQVYILPQRLHREILVGTGAIFFAILNVLKVGPFMLLGQFSTENMSTSAVLFPLAVAATFVGVWLVRRVQSDRFYTFIYILLIFVGGRLIWQGLSGLF
jgi:uncharacterized protein